MTLCSIGDCSPLHQGLLSTALGIALYSIVRSLLIAPGLAQLVTKHVLCTDAPALQDHFDVNAGRT